jgi:hypothetical protein
MERSSNCGSFNQLIRDRAANSSPLSELLSRMGVFVKPLLSDCADTIYRHDAVAGADVSHYVQSSQRVGIDRYTRVARWGSKVETGAIKAENLVFIGATGVGKTGLASPFKRQTGVNQR